MREKKIEFMESEKIYYSMTEAQEMTGLPASTLRYWERHFEQLSPRKDGHGNRYYTSSDIDLIKQIRYLRDEMHITRIQAIRQELKNGNRLPPTSSRDSATRAYRIGGNTKIYIKERRLASLLSFLCVQ